MDLDRFSRPLSREYRRHEHLVDELDEAKRRAEDRMAEGEDEDGLETEREQETED